MYRETLAMGPQSPRCRHVRASVACGALVLAATHYSSPLFILSTRQLTAALVGYCCLHIKPLQARQAYTAGGTAVVWQGQCRALARAVSASGLSTGLQALRASTRGSLFDLRLEGSSLMEKSEGSATRSPSPKSTKNKAYEAEQQIWPNQQMCQRKKGLDFQWEASLYR